MRKTLKLLSMALILTMALSFLHASAENLPKDGKITITVGNDESQFDREGIIIDIYLIARGNYGDWTMLDAFSDITVFVRKNRSASVNKRIEQIEERIKEQNIKKTQSGETDSKGVVTFSDLERGIYFVQMPIGGGPDGLKMNPMLVATPDRDGNILARANAKSEFEPTPAPTNTPKPTLTPFVTPEGENDHETPSPAPATRPPVATPAPSPDPDATPIPSHVPQLSPQPGETPIIMTDYETALGLGNIQMHVGVCFE